MGRPTPAWRRYLRFSGPDIASDIDEELRFHFEERIEELLASGLSREEANARALDRTLVERDALPAVVHCSTGQRVAALLGLKAFVVDRVSEAAAIDLAKSLGLTKLEAALRKRIAEICKADKSRNCEPLP